MTEVKVTKCPPGHAWLFDLDELDLGVPTKKSGPTPEEAQAWIEKQCSRLGVSRGVLVKAMRSYGWLIKDIEKLTAKNRKLLRAYRSPEVKDLVYGVSS